MPGFTIIVAHDSKRGIGKSNSIPWFLKEDLLHFKNTTIHGIVIMGRNTWESLPKSVRPLPMRDNVIVSKKLKEGCGDPESLAKETESDSLVFKCIDFNKENIYLESSLDEAIEKWTKIENKNVFVIGGASIYQQVMDSPLCDRLLITHVEGEYECDTFFPEYQQHWHPIRTVQEGKGYEIIEYRKNK